MASQVYNMDGADAKYIRGRNGMKFFASGPANGVQLGCPVICGIPTLVGNGCKNTYTPNQLQSYKSVYTADPMTLNVDYSTPGAVPFWTSVSFPIETDSYDPWAGSQKYLETATAASPPDLFFEFRNPRDNGTKCTLLTSAESTTIDTPDTWTFPDTDAGTSVLSWNASEYWSQATNSVWTGAGTSGAIRAHGVAYTFNHIATFTPVYSGGPALEPSNRFSMAVTYRYDESDQTAAYWQATEIHNDTLSVTSSQLSVVHYNGNTLRGTWTPTNDGTVPASIAVRRS
tara:strand:- start:474 stop:1331 length:858 start_codon:yes stop_codon:yes gene_type:complete